MKNLKWKMSSLLHPDVEVIVIGGGAAGLFCAIEAGKTWVDKRLDLNSSVAAG